MTSHRDDDDQQAEAAEAPPRAFALGRTSWAKTSVLKQFKRLRFRGQFATAVEAIPKLEGLIDPTLLNQAFRVNSTLVKLLADIEIDITWKSVTLFSAFEARGEALPLFDGLDNQVVDARATPAGPSGSSSVKAASDAQAEADRQDARRELAESFKASFEDEGRKLVEELKATVEADGKRIFGDHVQVELSGDVEKVIEKAFTPVEPAQVAPIAPEAPKTESWGEPLKVIVQARYQDVRAAFEFTFLKRLPKDPEGYTVLIGLPAFLGFTTDEMIYVVGEITAESCEPRQWAEQLAGKMLRDQVEATELAAVRAARTKAEAELAAEKADPTLLINKSDAEIDELVKQVEVKGKLPKAWGTAGLIERDGHTFIFGPGNLLKNGETEYPIEIAHNGVIRLVMATEYEVLENDPSGWCDEYLLLAQKSEGDAPVELAEAPGFHWGNPARFVHKTSVEGREATFEVEVSRDPTSESWFMSIIPPTWFASSAYDFEVDDDTAESVIVDDFASTQIDTMISAYKREKARDLAATRKQFDEKWDGLKEKASQPASEPESKPRKDLLLLKSLLPPGDKGDMGPARRRWDKRIADGASDAELQTAISNEYQRWTRKEAELRGFSVSAGAGFPAYWEGPFKAGKPATLKNAPLVDAVRALFKIPQPVEPEAKPKASKRAGASSSAKTKTDSVRKGSPRA